MITAIIGHRGVGKTSFVKRVKAYYDNYGLPCEAIDLDRAIEQQEDRTIHELFELVGESVFREIEINTLAKLVAHAEKRGGSTFIALGAGFQGEIPKDVRVWWLRRPTDSVGRIFLDRPRIEKDLSPLDEYKKRYHEREVRFRDWYHQQICISEGWESENNIEPYLFGIKPAQVNAAVTLLPECASHATRLKIFLENMLTLGVRFIELRDDLLSEEQIRDLVLKIPADKILISFRKPQTSKSLLELSGPYATDWAIELGPSPLQHNTFLSLHERFENESIEEAAERLLQAPAEHYKFAPPVHDFVELWAGHRFFAADTNKRSFLPRSADGRWSWYRQLQKNKMWLNFIRVDDGSGPDQPTLFEYLRLPHQLDDFAAVLGDPISHSRSPAEHHDFFRARNMSMLPILMKETECHSLHLSVLERLGMKAAAVTSPLKIKMRECCFELDRTASEVNSVNTLLLSPQGWHGTNTDVKGLESLFSSIALPENTAVWGGGGTRWALRSILRGAHFFSARKGEEIWVEKKPVESAPLSPEVVVWALGRARWETSQKPPAEWRPRYVIDLNYSEDSPGLEMAMNSGAKYLSGKAMFKAQAEAQRIFWEKGLPT